MREGLPLALALLGEAVEGLKAFGLAKLQDSFGAGHPVGTLAVNQVADNVESAPGLFPFVAERPSLWQIAQKRIKGRGRACQKYDGVLQVVLHDDSPVR